MAGPLAARRAKTKRGRREILKKEPKVVEDPKVLACVRGHATSAVVNAVLQELKLMKKPLSKSFSRKNEIRPFEPAGEAPLESLLAKNNCSLFALGNHTKKRPNNLILGRLFDGHLLDMVEFGVDSFKSLHEFKGRKPTPGSEPCIVFKGDFSTDETLSKVRSLLLDFFHGRAVSEFDLTAFQGLVSVRLLPDEKIEIRNYFVLLKKSGGRLPRVELEETGPTLELSLRRKHFAAEDLRKASLKRPREGRTKKVKNVSYEQGIGNKLGRVHVEKQDIDELNLRKMKGLKRRRLERVESANAAADEGEGTGDGSAPE